MFDRDYRVVESVKETSCSLTSRYFRTVIVDIMFETSVLTLNAALVMVLRQAMEFGEIEVVYFGENSRHYVMFKNHHDAQKMWWSDTSRFELSKREFVSDGSFEIIVAACPGTMFINRRIRGPIS